MDIAELRAFSVKNAASDLHLSAGLPPMIRVDGDVRRINVPPLDNKAVHAMLYDIKNDKQNKNKKKNNKKNNTNKKTKQKKNHNNKNKHNHNDNDKNQTKRTIFL